MLNYLLYTGKEQHRKQDMCDHQNRLDNHQLGLYPQNIWGCLCEIMKWWCAKTMLRGAKRELQRCSLVGGDWNMFYFSIWLGINHHPNWRTDIFLGGVGSTTKHMMMDMHVYIDHPWICIYIYTCYVYIYIHIYIYIYMLCIYIYIYIYIFIYILYRCMIYTYHLCIVYITNQQLKKKTGGCKLWLIPGESSRLQSVLFWLIVSTLHHHPPNINVVWYLWKLDFRNLDDVFGWK